MSNIENKIEDFGATPQGQLSATEFNEFINDHQQVIVDSGQTLANDTTQLSKSIAIYAQAGLWYDDQGVADAYSLFRINVGGGELEIPPVLRAGLKVAFIADNANTGVSTLAIDSIAGTKDIKTADGSALTGGEITTNKITELTYDGTEFRITSSANGGVSVVNLGYTPANNQGTVTQDTGGTNAVIPAADNTNAGLLKPVTQYTNKVAPVGADKIILANSADGNQYYEANLSELSDAVGSGTTGAWKLIQTQTLSGSPATVDFTTGIDATYNLYKIVFQEVDADSLSLALRTSTNGGISFDTTNYNRREHYAKGSGVPTVALLGANNDGSITVFRSDATIRGLSGEITFSNPSNASEKTLFHSDLAAITSTTNNSFGKWMGYRDVAEAVNAIRFTGWGGGPISGSISLYGIDNSVTATAGAWEVVENVDISGSPISIDFTIPNDNVLFKLEFNNVKVNSGTFDLRVSNDGGTTFETTLYNWRRHYADTSGGIPPPSVALDGLNNTNLIKSNVSAGVGESYQSGSMLIAGASNGGIKTLFYCDFTNVSVSTSSDSDNFGKVIGYRDVNEVTNAIRLLSTNFFESGSITLYKILN